MFGRWTAGRTSGQLDSRVGDIMIFWKVSDIIVPDIYREICQTPIVIAHT